MKDIKNALELSCLIMGGLIVLSLALVSSLFLNKKPSRDSKKMANSY